jgi:cystathionine beta-lyase/cystathionine gamma-synthase
MYCVVRWSKARQWQRIVWSRHSFVSLRHSLVLLSNGNVMFSEAMAGFSHVKARFYTERKIMNCFTDKATMPEIIRIIKQRALTSVFSGTSSFKNTRYLNYCTYTHLPTGIGIVFTRDAGMHAFGWWKNPDYERCYHLSLSFRDRLTMRCLPFDKKKAAEWVTMIYGDDSRLLWCEPPFSTEGKLVDVWHYRLFCDPKWQPIKPRKEVYTKEFTEKGWKSWSEVNAQEARQDA